jgi:glycosyltransferase involved in cell wall biosynthesis
MIKGHKKISLIIPALNEADNISAVLNTATKSDLLDEIIVVADACSDSTAQVANKYQVKVIERPTTQGKGSAMIAGAGISTGDIIMFADADLENFTVEHIDQVLQPVITGQATMSIGLRDRILGLSVLIPKIQPLYAIGGERAMTRDFFDSLPDTKNALDFGIETVMNYYAKENHIPVAYPTLKNLSQVIKEKKYGLVQGFVDRINLTRQVTKTRKLMKQKK